MTLRTVNGPVEARFTKDFQGAHFKTVNGVAAHGGSMGAPGPTVAGGTVFVGSGYTFGNGNIGNGDRGNGNRGNGEWKHNPEHRGGVPYRSMAASQRFGRFDQHAVQRRFARDVILLALAPKSIFLTGKALSSSMALCMVASSGPLPILPPATRR